jgi:hypothetical protein
VNADGRPSGSVRGNVAIALTALAGATAYASWFYPGVMSFDSAYAWWQVRGGETSDLQPPMMMRVWQLCDTLLPGPGLLFLLHLAAFWCGLALIASCLSATTARRIGFILVVAGAPVVFVLFAQVWTDVALMAAMTLACAAIVRYRSDGRRVWLVVAAMALFYGFGVRHNAWPAVLPPVAYAGAWVVDRSIDRKTRATARWRGLRIAAATGAALAVLGLGTLAINAQVDRHVALLPILQLCDLATMSADTGEMLVPAFALAPGSGVEMFRKARKPWSCVPLYAGTREPSGASWTPAERRSLTRAWLGAIARHPIDYLRERARRLLALIGSRRPDWPYQLVFIDRNAAYLDNPRLPANTGTTHAWWMHVFHRFRATTWLAAWPYLVLAVTALAIGWRRRHTHATGAAVAVVASGILYALPYCLIVPSAELRYLGWTCLAAVLGCALACFAPARQRIDACC